MRAGQASTINLSFGLTLERYREVEPTLTRPLSLGPLKSRPKAPEQIVAMDLADIQARGPVFQRSRRTKF